MPNAGGAARAAGGAGARAAKKAAAAGSSTARAKKTAPPAGRRPVKKAAAGSSTSSRTGLQLDPNNPGDAKIMDRQRKAAAAAGAGGQDRGAVTTGRPDLEKAFDEGAQQPDAAEGQEPDEETGPGAAERAKNAAGATGQFLSRGSWSPTLKPPTRARDVGGLAFGLLLYTAVITYIRYGAEGWTGWLSAKFLNKPLQGVPGKGGPKKDVDV